VRERKGLPNLWIGAMVGSAKKRSSRMGAAAGGEEKEPCWHSSEEGNLIAVVRVQKENTAVGKGNLDGPGKKRAGLACRRESGDSEFPSVGGARKLSGWGRRSACSDITNVVRREDAR